ncbi:MAG: S8 family serine peptidase, partial [Planctomycetes bacterium]|nr:S8 family serine peptidase [Planctomycetota bacterium]
KINCEKAWDQYTGNPAHLCAMIDTGVDMGHSDLASQYAGGYDYYSNDSNPDDQDGHGTHTGGTVAARTNNNLGVAGVAWNCRILAYRVGNYSFPTTAIVNSINAAKNAGALVISMSFGSYQSSSSISSALTSANNAGVVCVAAAGNDNTTALHYPSALAPVIAVASSNQIDGKSSFSNYGSWVEVAAPGQNILSTYDGNQYAYADGTSMACPHVAGMATLLYSRLGGARSKANADTVRAAIENSCVPQTYVQFGRVDLEAAMFLISPPLQPFLASVSPQQVQSFQGGTLTLTGTDFNGITQVTVAGVAITGNGINVVNSTEIRVNAPTAPGGLGLHNVTVTNSAGTSNAKNFSYIETSPPKLSTTFIASNGDPFSWEYGGGANDIYGLVLSFAPDTIPFKGYDILQDYYLILISSLSSAGVGALNTATQGGFGPYSFYSQIFTFDDLGSHPFTGASNITTSIILN